MRGTGDYPMGAMYDSRAPWNQVDTPEEEFDMKIEYCISRDTTVKTNDYEREYDDEGIAYPNTDDTDWLEAYKSCHYSPLQIFEACKSMAEWLVTHGVRNVNKYYLPDVIKDCENWQIDEVDYDV